MYTMQTRLVNRYKFFTIYRVYFTYLKQANIPVYLDKLRKWFGPWSEFSQYDIQDIPST